MTATSERLWFIWITSLNHGVDHAVTDDEVVSRTAEHPGAYRAVCGAEFLPAAMECAPRPPCPYCSGVVRPKTNPPTQKRRRRWWRRGAEDGR